MPGVRVSLDVKAVDKTIGCMLDQLKNFNDDVIGEFSHWQTDDLHRSHPFTIREEDGASTVIQSRGEGGEVLQPELRQSLIERMRDLMHSKLSWTCITQPRLPRYLRVGRAGSAWYGWEREWIQHRRAAFQARYGARWKRILYATAYKRYKHRYPRG